MSNQTLKTRHHRSSVPFLLGLLCLLMTFLFTTPTLAAPKKPVCKKTQVVYLRSVDTGYFPTLDTAFIYVQNATKDAQIYDIKCTGKNLPSHFSQLLSSTTDKNGIHYGQKNAPKAVCLPHVNRYGIDLKPGKSTATVSFKVKQNKHVYNLSCKLVFKRQTSSVFKSIKIGKQNYAAKAAGKFLLRQKLPTGKVKIKVAMNQGYQLGSIYINRAKGNTAKSIKVKNGSTVTLKKGDQLYIHYLPTKRPAGSPSNILNYFKTFNVTKYDMTFKEISDFLIIR